MTDINEYCRAVETHLCRRNEGHLIRVVGPAFEIVKSWAETGVPLAIVCEGIDRTVARAARKGPRRRPLPLEFCAGDVLDGFDRWRRAVGVLAPAEVPAAALKRGTLASHVDRVVAQLSALLGSDRAPEVLQLAIRDIVAAVDNLRADSVTARGAARDAVIAALAALDLRLLHAADAVLSDQRRTAITRDADAELAPFRGRLDAAQWATALAAARARLVRIALGLPTVAFD
ncbi:MAG TPA: hypothetical protein VMW48_09940 [Vicinamibacterales bacterium]|nr:hypothetical protein [Vicinamibacterales bacterium]